MNLAELLVAAAARDPGRTSLRHGRTEPEGGLDYAGLCAEAGRVARWLGASGVSSGERVALVLGNVWQFAAAYFGALAAGAVAVPVNPALTRVEIGRVLEDCSPVAAIVDPAVEDALRGVPDVRALASLADWERLGEPGPLEPAERDDEDLAVLAYTSGTTGEPRGAMLTHGNLRANLDQQLSLPETLRPDDVVLLTLPLSHIFGLNVGLGLTVAAGASAVLLERFEPEAALRTIVSEHVTVLLGPPQMYAALVATPQVPADTSSLRLAISGAAPLSVEVFEAFERRFGIPVHEGYGLTETAPTLTTNRVGPRPRPGSVGLPLPGVELRLVDERGHDVEPGDPGEVVVRGPNVFKGYWNRPQDTERAFVDGWFRTGDIAVRDDDGYYHLVDRARDLIIVSGFNVFPAEVEQALASHPSVAEAAVVGVPDERTGEAVKAYVVPAEGRRVDEAELRAHLARLVARFKVPRDIEVVDSLPHVATGKVPRRILRD